MAQKLSVEIALEGGAEIERQLQDIGKAGTKAFNEIVKSAGKVGGFDKLDPKGIEARFQKFGVTGADAINKINKAVEQARGLEGIVRNVQRAEQAFTKLGQTASAALSKISNFKVESLVTSFGRVETAATSMMRRLTLISGAVVGAGGGFLALVNSAANAADNLQETAVGAGVSAEAFQALSNAAADSGIETDKLAQSMGLLSKAISEQDTKDAAANFGTLAERAAAAEGPLAKLGISARDSMGNLKGADQVLLQVADAFQKMPDGTKKTTAALELFGRGGRKMIDFLNKGSEGIKELAQAMAVLGFTTEQFAIGDKFAQQMLIMTTALSGVKNQIGIAFAPGVGQVVKAFTDRILANFGDFRVRMAAIAEALKPVFADIANFVRGGEGPPQTAVGQALIEGFLRIKAVAIQAKDIVVAAFNGMRAAAAGVAGVINNLFGTTISGDALLITAAVLKVSGALGLFTAAAGLAMSALSLLGSAFGLVVAGARAFGLALTAAFAVPAATLFAPILLALAALALAFLATSEKGQEIISGMMDAIAEIVAAGAKKAWDVIVGVLSTPPQNVFQWIVDDINKFLDSAVENARRAKNMIQKALEKTGLAQPGEMQGPPDLRSTAEKEQFLIKQETLDKSEKATESWWDRFKKLSAGSMEQIEKLFPGLGDAVRKSLGGLDKPLDPLTKAFGPVVNGFGNLGTAAQKAGQDIATAMQQAAHSMDDLIARQKQSEQQAQEGVKGLEDNIEQLKLQMKFETDPKAQAMNRLRLKQMEAERSRRQQAAAEQQQQNRIEQQRLQEENDLKLRQVRERQAIEEQEARERERAQEQERRERAQARTRQAQEQEQDQRRQPTPSPFLPFDQREGPPIRRAPEGAGGGGLEALKQKADAAKEAISTLEQAMAGLPEKFTPLADAATAAASAVTEVFQTLPTAIGEAFSGIGELATNAFQGVSEIVNTVGSVVTEVFQTLPTAIGEAFSGIGELATNAFSGMSEIVNTVGSAVTEVFQTLPTAIGEAFSGIGELATNAFLGMSVAAETAATAVSGAFANINILEPLGGQLEALIEKFNRLAASAARAASAAASAGGGGGGGGGSETPALASGGLLGGRGTGTSDSNLAWVSRGEHVMPARAVRQPGVLAFLEALRRSGGNLRGVLDDMGRFARGGLVTAPAFASGGLAGSSNVTIQFPGLPPISGLRASSDVVDQLHKAAALAQVRSGGRKPSRYS